jgi:hypothetical protein
MIFSDNSLSIGRTPLIKLNRVIDGAPVTMLAKIEARNPAFSVKCRIGASMIWDAEQRGILKPGKELIEPTSGNTGIALAFVGAARGYEVTLLMPETMSVERRKVLKALGAKLILTDGSQGMSASITRAEDMVASDPDRYVLLQQFKNPANPERHQGQCRRSGGGDRHRRHHHRHFSLFQTGKEKEDPVGGRGAGNQSGDHADPGRGCGASRPDRNSGNRRGLYSANAGLEDG